MKKTAVAYVALLFILFTMPALLDAANPCFSTLGTDLKIHVPALSYGGNVFTLDLDYSATGPTAEQAIWFKRAGAGLSPLTACSYPATFFAESGKLIVRIPMVLYGTISFWVEFEYVPSNDGQIWLKAVGLGLMPNQVFITSVKGTGNLGSWPDAGRRIGLDAGDAICQARANEAGLQGTFRAWLSDDNNDAYCRVHGLSGKKPDNCSQAALPASAGPWVRTDGFPFGDSIEGLINDGRVYAPVGCDEYGDADADLWYFTGTTIDGTLDQHYAPQCANWTSGAPQLTSGSVNVWTSFSWSIGASSSCDSPRGLLCFQTGPGQSLPSFRVPGKRAFVTSVSGNGNLGSWSDAEGTTGIAAGDTICQRRAEAAGFPNAGRFKAWLSDSRTDAKDRIVSDGPWVRPDGVKVADSKASLTEGIALFSTINQTETGTYKALFDYVWTGTNHIGEKATDTCNDWSDASAALSASIGRLWDAEGWTSSGGYSCNLSLPLYCFED